jgi:hypothetical protein
MRFSQSLIKSAAAAELRCARTETPFSDYARDRRRASTIKGNSHRQTIKRRHRSCSIKKEVRRREAAACGAINKLVSWDDSKCNKLRLQRRIMKSRRAEMYMMTHLEVQVIAWCSHPRAHILCMNVEHAFLIVSYMQFPSMSHQYNLRPLALMTAFYIYFLLWALESFILQKNILSYFAQHRPSANKRA